MDRRNAGHRRVRDRRQGDPAGHGLHRAERRGARTPAAARAREGVDDAAARPRRDRAISRGRAGVAGANERGAAEGGGIRLSAERR